MSSANRKPYETHTGAITQSFLDACFDNLSNKLEMICDIQAPGDGAGVYSIAASDRNKYVGDKFYEALLVFPVISRTVGEWLTPEVEFSTLTLELNNSDGRFNEFMPSGASFSTWIGRKLRVKLGVGEDSSSYTTIFDGSITEVGGFYRGVKSFTLVARDKYDSLNIQFPNGVLTSTAYPDIDDDIAGKILPVIYGDWSTNVSLAPAPLTGEVASIPCYPVNGKNAGVLAGTTYVSCVISVNANTSFFGNTVFLKRGDAWYLFDSADIGNVNVDKNYFEIKQGNSGGTTLVDGNPYQYATGDEFFCKMKGKDLGAYDDNLISQARDILITYGGLSAGDFDSNWDTYRDKASPTESAISTFKSRVWIQEPQSVIQYVLSMLEQVRLEAFISRDLKIKINSLHLDDFDSSPSFYVRNWDIARDSLKPSIDTRNNFNRAVGNYNFLPDVGENSRVTSVYRNSAAITAVGKTISKQIVFPNLYELSVVENQVKEILRLSSAYIEIIDCQLTWRSLMQDIGSFVSLNIQIAAMQLTGVPAMIREIGYDPDGLKVPVKLWSFQMVPFPGYTPGYAGTTGGSTATITVE